MVSVPLAVLPVTLTGLVVPKLKVGGWFGEAGPAVMAAVKTTLPVNPPLGTSMTDSVFRDVAPGVSEMLLASMMNPGGGTAVTVMG